MADAPALPKPDVSGVSEAWLRGIPHDPNDPDWSVYDTDIAAVVRAYNAHLTSQVGYLPLATTFVKAMCWTESGAASDAWNTRPLQIGNTGDAGLQELLKANIKNRLVLPPEFYKGGRYQLTAANVRTMPIFNLRAGVGYLLFRACTLKQIYVPADNGQMFNDKVRKPDSLYAMARRDQTTVEEIRQANPPALISRLKPQTSLQFRHMELQSSLVFRQVTTSQAAATYNNADVDGYTKKLNYCTWVLNGGALAADAAATKAPSK